MKEVIRTGHYDDRQFLRTRPVEHVGKRNRLIDLAMDYQRIRRDRPRIETLYRNAYQHPAFRGDALGQIDADACLPSIGKAKFADEFFIRKGIGWALRERSYAAPEEVKAFCQEYAAQLSPLTVREALKVIEKRSPREN